MTLKKKLLRNRVPDSSSGLTWMMEAAEMPEVGLSFGICRLAAGESFRFDDKGLERAILGFAGKGTLRSGEKTATFERREWIETPPAVVHCSAGQRVGHGEVGEEIFKIRDRDLLVITDNQVHAQVSAPGYHMYYLWAIRHLEGNRYRGFTFDPAHAWTLKTS